MSDGLGARLLAACQEIASDLTAAGVPATMHRSQTQTPGVWVTPQSVDVVTLGAGAVARVHLVLVVSDQDEEAGHIALAGLLDRVLAADVCGGQLVPVEPVDTSWALVVRDIPLPAYRVAVDLDL